MTVDNKQIATDVLELVGGAESRVANIAARADNGVGQHIFYRRRRVLDALNAVVQIIYLTAAPELRVHRLREHLGIVLDNIGLHRRAVVRRFFEY